MAQRAARLTTPIKHVVFIVQENRSFNNIFMGYPGAKTAKYGYDSSGGKVELKKISFKSGVDPAHDSNAFFTACNGTGKLPGTNCQMNGWDLEPLAPKNSAYAYLPKSEVAPYWTLAHEYVLADRMFASNLDGSFVAHQYMVAAYASHTVDFPIGDWGCEGSGGDSVGTLTQKRTYGPAVAPCFDIPTIAGEADTAGVSWRFYADGDFSLWNSYQADSAIYNGPDWNADIETSSQFLTDASQDKLAAISWVTPTWQNSDHPGIHSATGPAWVASVVNAVGTSQLWNSTAIFIIWDDWGGWFDPVPPVFEDYDGLGFRVPLLIVSPYAKQGSVTHEQYETTSIVRFIEDDFGLAQLAKADARANDPANDPNVFDFSQKPRKFVTIPGSKPLSYWVQLERSPVDARAALRGTDGD
ncbi:MAG: alkaline phosphatase family protein [Candidatus Cybelea sp.]